MSNVKISALPVGVATSSTPFPAVVGGVTNQVTLAPLYTAIAATSTFISAGYCRLQVDSTTSLSLQRYQGSTLPIKTGSTWAAMAIPASGPSLSTSGLSASTLYYIYAFSSSGTLTLEASITARATDATTGVEIKSGDATRTLVGMVFTDSATHFISSATNRGLLNWFNRRDLSLVNGFTANRTTTSTTYVEINTEIRVEFLTWVDESVEVAISGTGQHQITGIVVTSVAFDGTTAEDAMCAAQAFTNTATITVGLALSKSGLAEGHHYATLIGRTDSGTTATWYGGTVGTGGGATGRCALTATIRG